jgi:dihydrofolate synthase/folylpolyglutamate synthase
MQDLLDWLLVTYGQEQMRPGLERMGEALKNLLPKLSNARVITIAGTNGKGETTLRLSQKLNSRKHLVWTSPHVERITERFRSERGEIEESRLRELVSRCHQEVVRANWSLSFYEFLFFVFCTWAVEEAPEFLLLEVGLGGRLDAVNVVDAELVLLPSISRDHQEILGLRYDQILQEKLGVLRPHSTLIHFLESKYLTERVAQASEAVGAKCVTLNEIVKIPEYDFSLRNEVLAGAAFANLMGKKISSQVSSRPDFLPHRGEVVSARGEWSFFGSHNVDGLRKLILFLHSETYNFSRLPYDQVIVAFSKRSKNDLRVMMRMLRKARLGEVVVTIFDHPKAASRETMEELSREEGLKFVKDIQAHVQGFDEGRVLVTGSYYFLGHFKSLLRGR